MREIMASKQLASILGEVPSATAKGENRVIEQTNKYQQNAYQEPEIDRINMRVPRRLKEDIKTYLKNNKGQTETTLILGALKSKGFDIPSEWLVDKRTLRYTK